MLDKNTPGYYLPSVCHAHCTAAKLIWFSKNSVSIIEMHQAPNEQTTLTELLKSAASYLKASATL